MLFYTGKGDRGESLVGKNKVPKDSPILEALGELDELNSLLGWIRSDKGKGLDEQIKGVQETLFIVQARIAHLLAPEHKSPEFSADKVKDIEKEIEAIEAKLKPERGFIVPGAEPVSAQLDYARAVCRRVERRVFALSKQHELPQEILTYLNRLSSYLYALARLEASDTKTKEKKPKYK